MFQGPGDVIQAYTELRFSKNHFKWVRSSMVEQTAVNRSVVGSSPTVPASTSMAHVASGQRGEVFKPLTRILRVSTTTGISPIPPYPIL